MINLQRLAIGVVLACVIAYAAHRAHALNRSGMWAAAGLGTVVMGLGGFGWAVLLMGFFISSSLLSRLFKNRKYSLNEKYAKGSERDAAQVLANGGVAGLIILLLWVVTHNVNNAATGVLDLLLWMMFAGALAAANADTWATELGALSSKAPRLITSMKIVEPGASGGVTLTGTLAALLGSAFIALLAVILWPVMQTARISHSLAYGFALITIAGLAGSLVDSLLGATLQAIYFCPVCRKETEWHPLHSCGNATTLYRGLSWLNNDWVNTLCTLSGALFALLFVII